MDNEQTRTGQLVERDGVAGVVAALVSREGPVVIDSRGGRLFWRTIGQDRFEPLTAIKGGDDA